MRGWNVFFLLGDMWNRVSGTNSNLRMDNRRWDRPCFGITVWTRLLHYQRTLLCTKRVHR